MKGNKKFEIGKLWLGKRQPEKTRSKRSAVLKQLWLAGKWKPWNKGKKLGKEHKQKLRESNIQTWKNPSLKQRMSRIKKEHWKRKGAKEKLSKKIKKFWRLNPEKLSGMRKKIILKYKKTDWEKEISKALKEYWRLNPQEKLKSRKKQKELYKNHPTMRRERQLVADLYYATHPDERRHFFGYKAKKTRYWTALGYVKSKIEKKVLDYLSQKEIREQTWPEYEPFTLYLPNTKPIPDIFLRKLNVIVEIYGGHPRAYKRKVKKNRDYRACKIPLVSITPGKIWNLDRYLLKEAIKLSKTSVAKNFRVEKFLEPKKEWLEKLKKEIKKLQKKKVKQ